MFSKSIAVSSLFILFAQGAVRVLNFAVSFYVIRSLGVADYGKLAYALSLIAIFSTINDLGITTFGAREVAKDRALAGKYVGNALTVRLILSFLATGLVIFIALLAGGWTDVSLVALILTGGMTLNALSNSFGLAVYGLEMFKWLAFLTVLSPTFYVILALLMLYTGYGLIGVAFASTLASALGFLAYLFICTFMIKVRPLFTFDLSQWIDLIRGALPLGLSSIFVMLYYRLDSVLLFWMKGEEVVGSYNAAYVFINGLLLISTSFTSVLLPIFSRSVLSGYEKVRERLYLISFKMLLLVGVFIALGLTLSAPLLAGFLVSPPFIGDTASALRILAWALMVMFVNALQGMMLISLNQQTYLGYVTGMGALSNVLANLMLIPGLSLLGAAAATVLAEVVVFFLCLRRLRLPFPPKRFLKQAGGVLSSGVIMLMGWLAAAPLGILGQLLIGVMVYLLALWMFKLLSREDLRLLAGFMK